jgi:class 3 adenylate cyclase
MKIYHFDLGEIKSEFLKYAPAYAQKEAKEAIHKVMELQMQNVIRNGMYYIVLADLQGSTKYAKEYGNKKLAKRIQHFVTSSFRALNEANLINVGLFIKEIGDAVLFIFQHFPDILKWHDNFLKWLKIGITEKELPLLIRTCIHAGEVYLDGVNPLSLAVSQTFKMEKLVEANNIVLTEPAYLIAWPTLARAYHGFEVYGEVELEGTKNNVRLYKLIIHTDETLKDIIDEKIE